MREAVRSSVQTFKDMRTEQELQVQYGKTYSRLLTEGILPAEAERLANFDKLIAGKLKENEIQTAITKNELAQAGLSGVKIKELEDRLKLLGLIKEAITGEAVAGPGAGPTNRERLQTEADRVRGELNTLTDPINAITAAAAGIGDAFGTSFKGIIDGSMTAKEALASFFSSVADHVPGYGSSDYRQDDPDVYLAAGAQDIRRRCRWWRRRLRWGRIWRQQRLQHI
jgi:hypothetical protein